MAPLLLRLPLFAAAAAACLLDWELQGQPAPESVRMRRQTTDTVPIGEGNRFKDEVPRGVGTQAADTVVKSIMNPAEIRSALDSLAKEFDIEVFETPEETHDGNVMFGGKLGNSCPRAIITAGIHARERGGPDNLVYFIADLLWAQREKTGITYGGRWYTNADVNKALDAGIVFVPLQNPDGVAHDQAENDCWRKNRNPEGTVDLNRNWNYLWDFRNKFSPEVADNVASDDPEVETYHGTEAESEPETRNVKWVLDGHPSLTWAADIHSMAGVVLYSWGEDFNQHTNPAMNALNASYDGVRGVQRDGPDTQYMAYIDRDVWRSDSFVAQSIANGMMGAAGNPEIPPVQSINLYATSGAISDYISARSLLGNGDPLMHGLTIEFGRASKDPCPFYMAEGEFNDNIRAVGAGLMEFLLSAADEGWNDAKCDKGDGDSDSDGD